MPKKIAIYGGSFDPIHAGHLAVAQAVLEYVDEVWLMPCFSHMFDKQMRPAHNRLAFCRLAVDPHPGLFASGFEIEHNCDQGSYSSLRLISKAYPDCEFSFAIGQDNADIIHKWRNSPVLITEFRAIVVPRKGHVIRDGWYAREPHIYLKDAGIPEISSTILRQKLAAGDKTVQALMPSRDVYQAVLASGLYATTEFPRT